MHKPINLLWTGGWDSTFRLLQITIIEKKIIKPIYIVDPKRKSLNKELETIKNIIDKIKELDLEAYSRILPIWYVNENLTICEEIKKSSKLINSQTKMGSQHEWLAQFCLNYNLKNIEMSIEKNENTHSFTHFLIKNYIKLNSNKTENKTLYNNINTIFKYFSFPVINISKKRNDTYCQC